MKVLKHFFTHFVLCASARKRALKTLKPSLFVSGVIGSFVGFLREKRVTDGFARCLLCRVDLCIAVRGISNLWEHWKGLEHTRLEQKFGKITQKPLLDKSCRPLSADEDQKIRLEWISEPPVYLESPLCLTLDERIAIGESEAKAGAKPELSKSSCDCLWLCTFVNSFLNVTSFGQVQHQVDGWMDCMRTELKLPIRLTSHVKCPVSMHFSFCFRCNMLRLVRVII